MDIAAAQRDISAAYVAGAPGVLVSGIAWLAAGAVGQWHGPLAAFATLFIGGMLIVPLSLLIARRVFGTGKIPPGNPLERLGFEATIMLFVGILIAYVLLRVAPELAFPALAAAIGARYFAFRTLYDEPVYWLLGGSLAAIATVAMLNLIDLPVDLLLLVGIVECVFALLLFARWRQARRRTS